MKKNFNRENAAVSERLKKASKESGFQSIAALSKATEIPASTVEAYWKGKTKPGASRARLFAQKLNISADWLLYGENQTPIMENHIESHKDVATISYYDIAASAGFGSVVEEAGLAPENYCLPMAFFREILRASPKDAVMIEAKGDSMLPTIQPEARLIINRTETSHLEGVYVLTMNGELYVKRLLKSPEGIMIISDNPRYPVMNIKEKLVRWGTPDSSDEVGIIGKVIHVIQPPN